MRAFIKRIKFLLTRKRERRYKVEESWSGQRWFPLLDSATEEQAFFLHFVKPRKYPGLQVRVTRIK